ncbi:dihydrolipoamide acetyltransferase family protein [Antarctobacter jejuensis]|uniref:dihydrolipoamide acetyltransferase family protein n=1 Tax=Antarctobacter jejuensis TaxID=1439938 RepID=UPI003FD02DD5
MSVFRMPSLGADMEEAKLVEWLIHPGDTVKRGDVVAVVETQKGAIEIEVFEDGVVERIDAALGQTLPVGADLAVIRSAEEGANNLQEIEPPMPLDSPKPAAKPETVKPERVETTDRPLMVSSDDVVAASPAARSLALKTGIDLATLTGSGPQGAVLLKDVEERSKSLPEKPTVKAVDFGAMREAIAVAMSRSKREIPHYYLEHEIDLQSTSDWLAERNDQHPPDERILMGALFVRSVVLAAESVKGLNGIYMDGAFTETGGVNPGVAISMRGGGLISPAILGAETLDLAGTMKAMRDLVARARSGRLRGSEMTQGTITISSLGEGGVDGMTGVINPPQVALVAFGTPRALPRVVDGSVVARHCVRVTLAADHRVSDGKRGARFLGKIETLLNSPESL